MQERYEELQQLKTNIDKFMGREDEPKESFIKQIDSYKKAEQKKGISKKKEKTRSGNLIKI